MKIEFKDATPTQLAMLDDLLDNLYDAFPELTPIQIINCALLNLTFDITGGIFYE